MKLTVIESIYKRNPYIAESLSLNLIALDRSGVDYEIILFNDHGDIEIKDDLKSFLDNPRVVYVYSPINYGKGQCSGGWVGGIPYMSGDLIHFANQDDVYTPLFYKLSIEYHSDPEIMLTHTNAFAVNEKLEIKNIMLNPDSSPDYTDTISCFKWWFGVGENGKDEVTRANNNILAPSVIYKKKLHDLIGLPNVDTFIGACDFEYWSRILFYNYKCKLINIPLWLYRVSDYSATSQKYEGISADNRIKEWVELVKQKYKKLYEERKKNV